MDQGVEDRAYIAGANKKDVHLRDVLIGRDFEGERVDASDVREGDVCPKCGHESHIFGSGGAQRMATDYGTELLGQLPLDESIQQQTDAGKPTVVADPDGNIAEIYRRIARRCAVKIAESQRDMTSKFPNIVVQNT